MAEDETSLDLPWRKRHPVVSRLVLYVLGAALAALLVHLFLERKETDREDAQAALAAELDGLGTVLAAGPDGAQVLKILDEKFSDPGLPVKMRGRALRWRALAYRARKEFVRAESALQKADALDLEPLERAALHLEWAEAKTEAGDPGAALKLLSDTPIPAAPVPLELLRRLLMARAEKAADRPQGALAALRKQLLALEAPLDPKPTAYVGGREWTGPQLATIATSTLVALGGDTSPADCWMRLLRLAPGDFDAHVDAARALLALGRKDDARLAWAGARRIDSRLATGEANKDEALAGLED